MRQYLARFTELLNLYEELHGDLVAAYAGLQDAGILDILTSCATHAYLPASLKGASVVQRSGTRVAVRERSPHRLLEVDARHDAAHVLEHVAVAEARRERVKEAAGAPGRVVTAVAQEETHRGPSSRRWPTSRA